MLLSGFCKIYPVNIILDTYRKFMADLSEGRGNCVPVPDGMKEHQRFRTDHHPYHQTDWRPWWRYYGGWTSFQGLIPLEEYKLSSNIPIFIQARTEMAAQKGLILSIQKLNSEKHWWKDLPVRRNSHTWFVDISILKVMKSPAIGRNSDSFSKELCAKCLWPMVSWAKRVKGSRDEWCMDQRKFQTYLNFTKVTGEKLSSRK